MQKDTSNVQRLWKCNCSKYENSQAAFATNADEDRKFLLFSLKKNEELLGVIGNRAKE